ncbi:MAG: biopolymer transporter ExbD [Gammaproteobacteria bacterium]|nr:biopolymer transporter ExbD [Gammaproteobacteria bacterium]
MNLRPKRQEEPDVNLTPLIDVVFLMLIFFMVSTTFQKESIVKVDLPKASAEEEAPKEEVVEVTVNAAGEYFINRARVLNRDPKTLKAAIIKHAGSNNERPFIIRADAMAPHQAVVTVMDVAGQLGFSRLSIPTERQQDK